jgi:NADH-quinone oxidoreductase subunit G
MPRLTIDGIAITVAAGTSVLQACEQAGVEVPRFCYHEKLSVAGSCRMCLVEIEKMPKPVASCTLPCADGMVVRTTTPAVRDARKRVMEMLLINHPLDCPVCDQGGACDLQDQAFAYGQGTCRSREPRRKVADKELGPLIKTVMTRCIHCTRCVRFMEQIAGTPELGGLFRGEKLEIDTGANVPLTSELSGNLIDICPTGALTSKPFAFRARPWELTATISIDVTDALGSAIRVDSRGNEVMRVAPARNDAINETWLSDKARFACDGLTRKRLTQPMARVDGRLQSVTWDEAFAAVAARLRGRAPERIAALAGDQTDVETLYAARLLLDKLGVASRDCRQDGAEVDISIRAGTLMNTGIAGLEEADALLLIGCDPRREAALLNARLRKRWLMGGCRIGSIGKTLDLTYPVTACGASSVAVRDMIEGLNPFAKTLSFARNPALILGAGALARRDGLALQARARELAERFDMVRPDWNGFNVLQTAAGRVGGLDVGFLPEAHGLPTRGILSAAMGGKIDVLFLFGADELDPAWMGNAYVVYVGTHHDRGASRADLVLPAATAFEKDATFVNTEGRVQRAYAAVPPPGEARPDWKIVRALADVLGVGLPFDTLDALRGSMEGAFPHLARLGEKPVEPWGAFGREGVLSPEPFASTLGDYYATDALCRASPTMAQCSAQIGPLTADVRGEG